MRLFITFIFFFTSTLLFAYTIPDEIKNFKATEAEKKAGAVIIKKERIISIDENLKTTETTHYIIAILNDKAARDYSQITLTFNSFYKKQKLNYAHTIDTTYNIIPLQDDAIAFRQSQNSSQYDNSKSLVFSLPAITPGSFIEFSTTSTSKQTIIKNYFCDLNYYSVLHYNKNNQLRVDSTRYSSIIVNANKNINLYFQNSSNAKLTQNADEFNNIYTWEIKQIDSIPTQQNVLEPINQLYPSLTISTEKQYDYINKIFYENYNKASTPNQNIKKLVLEITQNKTSNIEKIKALYTYMQKNVKYIYAHIGKTGYFPHNASEILDNKYGDCKDQTTLFISFLKSLNIQAYPAFVNTMHYKLEDDSIANLKFFNHVLVYIPEYNLWIDNTGNNFLFPGRGWQLNSKKSLIVTEKGPLLKQLPSQSNQLLKARTKISQHNNIANIEIYVDFNTYISDNLKIFIANAQDAHKRIETMFQNFFYNSELSSFKILNAEDPHKNIEVQCHLKITSLPKKFLFTSSMRNFINEFTSLSTLQSPDSRVFGYLLPYRLSIESVSTFTYPDIYYKAQFNLLPTSFNSKYFTYSFNIQDNQKSLITKEQFTILTTQIPFEVYSDFYSLSNKYLKNIAWNFTFLKDKLRATQYKVKNSPQKTIKEKITLIESYLDNAEYMLAKEYIEELLRENPNIAKIHYLYGLTLGYLDEFDKSDLAFQKAKQLNSKEQ